MNFTQLLNISEAADNLAQQQKEINHVGGQTKGVSTIDTSADAMG